MSELPPPRECANCGASIPPHAKACPECGADEHTGWREASVYDGLELPDSAFDANRAPQVTPPNWINGIPWYWWVVAVGLLLGAAVLILG